jgi:hypothetical protein
MREGRRTLGEGSEGVEEVGKERDGSQPTHDLSSLTYRCCFLLRR